MLKIVNLTKVVTQIPEKLNELIHVFDELFAFYECFYAKLENILTYCFKLIVKQ